MGYIQAKGHFAGQCRLALAQVTVSDAAAAGLGPVVTDLITKLHPLLGASVPAEVVAVRYPGVPVLAGIDGKRIHGFSFLASRQAGVRRFGALLTGLAHNRRCPRTVSVLAGYSQGADVIGSYLVGRVPFEVRQRIAAVAMLGNPRFNRMSAVVDAGSYSRRTHRPLFARFGIAPNWWRPAGGRRLVAAPFRFETVSGRNAGDFICDYTAAASACTGARPG